MIDDVDGSTSILRLLVYEALRKWTDIALMKLLEENDVIVRTAAARELQTRGGKAVFNKIQALTFNNQPHLREIAAFILGQLGTPVMPYKKESLPILMKLTSDLVADVRSAAAAAIGHLCYENMPDEVEKILIGLCSDENEDVRACAAYALGNSSGNSNIRKLLKKMLNQEYVGSYAELALEILNYEKKSRRAD